MSYDLQANQGMRSLLWWQNKETQGRDMVSVAQAIESSNDHQTRRRQSLTHVKLYSNRNLTSLYECGVATRTYDAGVYLTMNVVQSCVDTIAAKLWKTPRIQCSVQDGDWTLKQRAKKLTGFADGIWAANKWPGESRQWGVESTLFGTGAVLTYGEDSGDDAGSIITERVMLDELIFDETEAVNGIKGLRTIYRKKWVHKELLLEKWADYGDKKDKAARRVAILTAQGKSPRETGYAANAADMIAVYEGWHLPSKADGSDGRHVIAIEGQSEACTLFAGEWKRKRFPLSFLDWTRLPKGLIARSLAEELVPIQIRLNEILETIDVGQRTLCVPKVFYRANTINVDTWTNAFGELIQVDGDPNSSVRIETPRGVSEEIYTERDFWWKHSFEVTGISMLSATAAKPEGISSAVALRELLDREDMRLTPKGKQWEEANVDVFECVIDAADELAERKKTVSVQVPGKRNSFSSIQWRGAKGVDMDRDKYILHADAVNALPSTPQGRKQYAVELWQLQAISREQFLQMLELPDTGSTMNLILASLDLTEKAMEMNVDGPRYVGPNEYSDLKLAQTIATQTLMREDMDDAPDKVLERLYRFIDECSEMIAANDNAAQPAPAAVDPNAQAALNPVPTLPPAVVAAAG